MHEPGQTLNADLYETWRTSVNTDDATCVDDEVERPRHGELRRRADTLVDEFDIVDLLTTLSDRCVEVLDIAAAEIMLVDTDGQLRAMTSSSEAMRVVELFELQSQEGPCLN